MHGTEQEGSNTAAPSLERLIQWSRYGGYVFGYHAILIGTWRGR